MPGFEFWDIAFNTSNSLGDLGECLSGIGAAIVAPVVMIICTVLTMSCTYCVGRKSRRQINTIESEVSRPPAIVDSVAVPPPCKLCPSVRHTIKMLAEMTKTLPFNESYGIIKECLDFVTKSVDHIEDMTRFSKQSRPRVYTFCVTGASTVESLMLCTIVEYAIVLPADEAVKVFRECFAKVLAHCKKIEAKDSAAVS